MNSIFKSLFAKHCLFCQRRFLSTSKKELSVILYGTDRFSLVSLERLVMDFRGHSTKKRIIRELHVVSGKGSLVSQFAQQHGLELSLWSHRCLSRTFDVGLVVSFGHLIPEEDIARCRHGILNVHGSLLPLWRGASPIHHSIMNGDQITGVSVMRIKPDKFDVGDIVKQVEFKMPRRPRLPQVYEKLASLGAEALMETLSDLEGYLSEAVPQSQDRVTTAPKVKKDDGFIDFKTMTSVEVDRKVRALDTIATVFTKWINGMKLKLFDDVDPDEVSTLDIDSLIGEGHAEGGSIFFHRKRRLLCFKCSDLKWVGFESVSLQGKKRMSSLSFFNGFMSPLLRSNCQPDIIKTQKHLRKSKDG